MSKYISRVWGAQRSIGDEDARRLYFFKKLQAVTNKIHAAGKIKEIMLDLSSDICDLFACERLTIYAISEGRTSIETVIKTGLKSFKDFSLPISDKSVAGYVALTKKAVNIGDVYDETELKSYTPAFQFLQKVDRRTGYRTREMLVVPILNEQSRELLGVLQLINNRNNEVFPAMMEEGATELCKTLAIAFAQRLQQAPVIRSKYHPLVAKGLISTPELELAGRSARRKRVDLEDVLVNEFQVALPDVGVSLSQFFGVPYEPYQVERVKPKELLKNFKREFVEHCHWLLLEESEAGLVVLATDPERIKGSRVVNNLFPKADVSYVVTTNCEFRQTVEQFFGDAWASASDDCAPDYAPYMEPEPHAAAIKDLVQRVNKTIADAFDQDAADIHIELGQCEENIVNSFREDGSMESVSGQIVVNFHFNFPAGPRASSEQAVPPRQSVPDEV